MFAALRIWVISIISLACAAPSAAQEFDVAALAFGPIVQGVDGPQQQSFNVNSSPGSGIAFTITSQESWLTLSTSGDCSTAVQSAAGTTPQAFTACVDPLKL